MASHVTYKVRSTVTSRSSTSSQSPFELACIPAALCLPPPHLAHPRSVPLLQRGPHPVSSGGTFLHCGHLAPSHTLTLVLARSPDPSASAFARAQISPSPNLFPHHICSISPFLSRSNPLYKAPHLLSAHSTLTSPLIPQFRLCHSTETALAKATKATDNVFFTKSVDPSAS